DHKARVLVPNQLNRQPASLQFPINQLRAGGGTAIDEGLRLGIEELAKARKDTISQALLLTDGENEHGDNDRCLKLAKLGAEYGMTINTLGFGDAWNQDVLESIADAGGGSMVYIEQPDQASKEFNRLFQRAQAVGLTNAHLLISLMPGVRLAELKPLAQVAPDTIELTVQSAGERFAVRLGDLMTTTPRVVLANLYLSQLSISEQAIAEIRVRYDDPAQGREGLLSDAVTVAINGVSPYQPAPNPEIQPYILALAKYRQTQIAESKLQRGDISGAATMLQTAAKTALQMGDGEAATVLQTTATRLQSGEELSEAERKKTRMASKTTLQSL
ncbi:MAG TPA: VWA domain-containing protein, partial [Coleofasciculaceae cyanobacterium]